MGSFKLTAWKARFLASSSILVLTFAPHMAMADCSPNPTQDFTTTTCTGTEPNGITVATAQTTVNIQSGATLSAPNPSASGLTLTTGGAFYSGYIYYNSTTNNSGAINGGSQAGILATTSGSGYNLNATVNVLSGATVTGLYGVEVNSAANSYGSGTSLYLTNSGAISGTSGYAIYGANGAVGAIYLTNQSGGSIGGILAPVLTLSNLGTIDGGANSAFHQQYAPVSTVPYNSAYEYYGASFANAAGGLIKNNSNQATISIGSALLINNGTITNSGTGPAISSSDSMILANIGGVVNGDVIAGPGSTIDNSGGGRINGDVTFATGANRLVADIGDAANPLSAIAGSITATATATNTLQLNATSDAVLTSSPTLPSGFQKLVYGVVGGATLTVGVGVTLTNTVNLIGQQGAGKFVNNGAISTTGSAIAPDGLTFNPVSVTNNGVITATLSSSSAYAIDNGFYGLGDIVNTGAITAVGGGGIRIEDNYSATNSGTITADSTALYAFDVHVANSGVLHSNQGVGLYAFGNEGTPATNTGFIYGETIGAQLIGYSLTNSGTISSPGVAVSVDPGGLLINLVGGNINGTVGAELYDIAIDARIVNFGTINGDVKLGISSNLDGSGNFFIAQPGSVVNGNVVLGSGDDTFVTSLINTGPGAFAGVTGTVTGGGADTIRYLVTRDATAAISAPTLFGNIAYDLSNGAKLTLSAGDRSLSTLGFSGTGSVDLTADITGTGSNAILDLSQQSMQSTGSPTAILPTALDLTSHGALTQIHNSQYTYGTPAVRIVTGDSFTNAGTILAQDLAAPSPFGTPLAAIYGSGVVTNTGTISLVAADGVQSDYNALTVTNTGTIEQTGGTVDSRGVVGANVVTNTGTISVGGAGVILGGSQSTPTLTNSGSINSANDTAVSAITYQPVTVVNEAGGSITGATFGISLPNGSVINAGTIAGGTGSVVFYGYPYSAPYADSLTLLTGSTLIGDAIGSSETPTSLVLEGTGVANNNFVSFNSLTVQASGVWALNGVSAIAATEVVSGNLRIGDSGHPGAQLTGAVAIDAGGTLSGHGTIVGDVSNNGGVVAPGGSIGVLTIQGNYSQSASGLLSLEISPSSSSSLQVTGTANLAGEIQLVTDPGVYRKGQTYSFLTAGTVVGGFTKAIASNGLDLSLSAPAGVFTATFMDSNFALVGGTSNQTAVGAAFANYPIGVSDFDPIANAVIALPAGGRQNADLDQLGGEIDADLLTSGKDSARAVFDSLAEQLSEAGQAGGRSASGGADWGRVIARFGTIGSGADGAHGLRQTAGGVVAGGQVEHGGQTTLGAAFNYQHTDLSLRGLGQSGQFDTAGLTLYGEHRWGDLFLDGAASLAWDRGEGVRHIAFSGIDRRAEGQFDGYAAGAWASLGARVINAYGIRLEPSLSLAFSHVQQGDFSEAGAGGADLALASQAQDALQTQIGARLSKVLSTGHGPLTLEARLAETDELRLTEPHLHEGFAAAAGTGFNSAGADPGGAAGVVGAGFAYAASGRVTLFGHYDGTFGAHQRDQVFSLGGKMSW